MLIYRTEYTMDYLNENVAINVRRIRKSRNLSLDEMALETGVSKSMLGQIERGEANPTITTVGKITSAMRIGISELLGPPPDEFFILRRENLEPLKEESGQFRNFFYFPYEVNRPFEIYNLEVEPGGSYECTSHGENTFEYMIVFQGELTLVTEHETQVLGRGDALKFKSDQEHTYRNTSSEVLQIFMIFTWY